MAKSRPPACDPASRVVLVMQGGGALGAFQAGVYEAMHGAGIEPDWVVGTSIGAINAALIAGNKPEHRLDCLREFWERVSSASASSALWNGFGMHNLVNNIGAVTSGVPGFFRSNPCAFTGTHVPVGVTQASFYSTDPLRATLDELVNFHRISAHATRLTFAGRRWIIRFDAQTDRATVHDANGAQVPTVVGYWFAWYAFHPDTAVFRAEAKDHP